MQLLKQSMHATLHCILWLPVFLLIIDYATFNNSQNLKIFAYAVVFSVSTDPCIHYDCDINNLYHY